MCKHCSNFHAGFPASCLLATCVHSAVCLLISPAVHFHKVSPTQEHSWHSILLAGPTASYWCWHSGPCVIWTHFLYSRFSSSSSLTWTFTTHSPGPSLVFLLSFSWSPHWNACPGPFCAFTFAHSVKAHLFHELCLVLNTDWLLPIFFNLIIFNLELY